MAVLKRSLMIYFQAFYKRIRDQGPLGYIEMEEMPKKKKR